MNEDLLALKPYLESIKEHCSRLSKEEILEIILGLSKEIPTKQRIEFLDKIGRLSKKQITVVCDEDILQQIEALEEEIMERMASIEDGTYYEEYEDWDYHDEEPDAISEEQKTELEKFFKDAANLFLSGQLDAAREIYTVLFRLLNRSSEEGEYYFLEFLEYSLDVELREARARYCRCVYETIAPERRVQAMLDVMNIQAPLSEHRFDVYENKYPMLLDVMNSQPGELAEWETFLAGWKRALSEETFDRANLLLLEAVYTLEGLAGVESHIRRWGASQPRGYLYWIQLLVSEANWQSVAAASEEALSVLPHSHFRALAAEQLAAAGEKMGNGDLVLKGKRELFCSLPDDSYLLCLIEEAKKQKARASELEKVIEFLSTKASEEKPLLVKALLMAGKIEIAFEKAKRTEALGWSYGDSAGAILFGGVLSALSLDGIEQASTIKSVLRRYADEGFSRFANFSTSEKDIGEGICISEEILSGLHKAHISADKERKYLSWAANIGKRRIEQIVSDKHRKAYARAAEILGALAECYLLRGEESKSRRIVEEYRDQKYNRYSAFRREVNSVISASSLLHS